jgi:hypothetical protein
MSAFLAETVRGQTLARARLEIHPEDEDTLFFLGKLDLNYVWLQLGTLRPQNRVGRVLGGPPIARPRPANEPGKRSGPRRASLDRLHRRDESSKGCPLAPWGW